MFCEAGVSVWSGQILGQWFCVCEFSTLRGVALEKTSQLDQFTQRGVTETFPCRVGHLVPRPERSTAARNEPLEE